MEELKQNVQFEQENSITLLPSFGLVKFVEGICALFNFIPPVRDFRIDELSLVRLYNGEPYLHIKSKTNSINLGIPVNKLIEFIEESESVNEVKIGLYALQNIGDYLTPIGGFTISKEQIYEIKGILKVVTQIPVSANNSTQKIEEK
ncbi:MAG: hypothetical protein ACP5PT_08470 [Brevinematia bacterium]